MFKLSDYLEYYQRKDFMGCLGAFLFGAAIGGLFCAMLETMR